MEETPSNQHRPASRLGTRGGIGEIVEVQGGHIVRSTGRKDRHSKVCTAKGPRDRRVRLSAHTAIQFYDVQDRLGYDRPSKAVDWLIKNAKSAIDELAKLPAWNPNTTATQIEEQERENREANKQNQSEIGENPNSGFVSPMGNEIEIGESVKSFFPIETNANAASTASFHYQNYPPPDLVSRRNAATSSSQDLRLSLQSFQDPILIHQAQNQAHHHQNNEQLFPATTATVAYHAASFPDNENRMIAWNSGGGGGSGYNCHVSGGGGGFMFNSPPSMTMPMPTLPPVLMGQSQCLSQRGPLQSSNNNSSSSGNPAIRAWIDSSSSIMCDHQHNNQYFQQMIQQNQSYVAAGGGIGFDFGGGFSGFRIPARIQGEEEHDGVSDKPSSASSDSRH